MLFGNSFSQGLLWEISGKDLKKPSYIFGTYHLISKNFIDSLPVVKEKIAGCDIVAGEILMKEINPLSYLSKTLMTGKTLKDLLNQKEYDTVDSVMLKYTGASVEMYKSFKPIIIQTMLSTKIIPSSDMKVESGDTGMDVRIQNLGEMLGKDVRGLENVEDQMSILFEKITEQRQAQMLYEMARDIQKTKYSMLQLDSCYYAENISCLDEVIQSGDFNEEETIALVSGRNKSWTDSLVKWTKTKSVFAAVGAGHLGGKEGLIEMLKTKGFTVKPIYLNAARLYKKEE